MSWVVGLCLVVVAWLAWTATGAWEVRDTVGAVGLALITLAFAAAGVAYVTGVVA